MKLNDRFFFWGEGDCLSPSLKDSSLIEVKPVGENELAPGDLVVFKAEEVLKCHRIMQTDAASTGTLYLLRADASPYPDGWFSAADILGKVVAVNGRDVEHEGGLGYRAHGWHAVQVWKGYRAIFESDWGMRARYFRERFTTKTFFFEWYWRLLSPRVKFDFTTRRKS